MSECQHPPPTGSRPLTIASYLPRFVRLAWDRIESSRLGSRMARGALWSTAGTSVSRGLALLASIFVARIVGKVGFGEWAIVRATVGMLVVFAELAMGKTLAKHVAEFRQTDPARTGRILAISTIAALVAGVLSGLALALSAPWLAASMLGAPHLVGELRIAAVLLFLSALNGALVGALAGLEAFKALARVNVLAGICSFPLIVVGAWLGALDGALWGLAASFALTGLLLRRALSVETRKACVPLALRGGLNEIKVLWRFGLPTFLAGAIVPPAHWFVRALLVNQPTGYEAMAEFAAADQWRIAVAILPCLLCAGYLPVAASLNSDDSNSRRQLMAVTALVAGAVAAVTALLAGVLAVPILAAYGSAFTSATPVFLFVVGLAVLESVSWVFLHTILAAGRAWRALFSNTLCVLVMIALAVFLVPMHRALGLALAMCLAEVLRLLTLAAFAFATVRSTIR